MTSNGIGTLNEKPLHAALKEYCARPGDRLEAPVDGYVIDIVRGGLLIEIQTGNFTKIKAKLADLVPRYPLRLVYPIAAEKWIVKEATAGSPTVRRKSPKRGDAADLFAELVRFPELTAEPNFSLQVLLIREEEVRRRSQSRRAWRRRGWVTEERRLLNVLQEKLFESPADLADLLPPALPDPFTTKELAAALSRPRRVAQQMTYCLREMGALAVVGKRERSIVYTRTRD
jgi:hypothetical protein